MAGFKEQLLNVKLKKPNEPTKDFSSPKMAGFMKQGDIDDYQNKVLDVNTELWLASLKDLTFPTTYCPISLDEARVFVGIFERLFQNLDPGSIALVTWEDHLFPEEKTAIKNMKRKLQTSMDEYVKNGHAAFVKTSCRSPKDGPLAQKRLKEIYLKYLNAYPVEKQENENCQITALLKAAFEAMKVTNSDQVLDMFIRSERIYQDMLLAMAIPDRFRENFVVRKFVNIEVDMEFRGFVFGKSLTAMSQYNYLIYSSRLFNEKDSIKTLLVDFYQTKVRPRLYAADIPDNYIIDFAISEEDGSSDKKIWVIEINPFLQTTDGALFSWEHERHLLEGSEGFQFRIATRPKPGAKTMLPSNARDMLNLRPEHSS